MHGKPKTPRKATEHQICSAAWLQGIGTRRALILAVDLCFILGDVKYVSPAHSSAKWTESYVRLIRVLQKSKTRGNKLQK